MLYHTTINKDDRCLDLLLTEEEVVKAFERSVEASNRPYIDEKKCCGCWSIEKPPKCTFWAKIMGLCSECDE